MASKTAREIEHEWIARSCALALRTRRALRRVMLDLAAKSRAHSAHAWQQRKAPMALYHRVVATHCERLERALRRQSGERTEKRERHVRESYSTRGRSSAQTSMERIADRHRGGRTRESARVAASAERERRTKRRRGVVTRACARSGAPARAVGLRR